MAMFSNLARPFVGKTVAEDIADWEEALLTVTRRTPQLIEAFKKETGVVEEAHNDFLYAVYDQRDQMAGRPIKWKRWQKTKKIGICFHHTAVFNGFGARKGDIADFMKVVETFGPEWLVKPQGDWDDYQIARHLAVAKRYRRLSYHAIMAPNSVLVLNLPFDFFSFHGDGANRNYLGVAWDALSSRQPIDDTLARDLQRDLEDLIDRMIADGHECREFTCHCAWTNKPSDPGRDFILKVMVPVAKRHGITIRWDFKATKTARSLREVAGPMAVEVAA